MPELYHERWELELEFDEVKTEMLAREETLRSRSPELVEQELWATLLAYNLVRLEMERLAAMMGVEPVQLSFSGTLMMLLGNPATERRYYCQQRRRASAVDWR